MLWEEGNVKKIGCVFRRQTTAKVPLGDALSPGSVTHLRTTDRSGKFGFPAFQQTIVEAGALFFFEKR